MAQLEADGEGDNVSDVHLVIVGAPPNLLLVSELLAVNRLATSAVVVYKRIAWSAPNHH